MSIQRPGQFDPPCPLNLSCFFDDRSAGGVFELPERASASLVANQTRQIRLSVKST